MRQAADPFDAMAQFLADTFGRDVSPTLILDVFGGLCVVIIALLFFRGLRRIIRARDEGDDDAA